MRLIAFYLPQFHAIPENNAWWGEGFTEWDNVRRGAPLFEGHYQPRVPADLGYYDLTHAETRSAQAQLAAEHGISAFCYYHYWFGGKRLLERPFDAVLASGEPDFPFCLCWANEPWSRSWDGKPHSILQQQSYSAEDDVAHIRWLLPALTDRRAVTIDGKPVFLVYRAKALPDPARTVQLWRREVAAAGLPGIYLIAVETGWEIGWDATKAGFDARVLFQPAFPLLLKSRSRLLRYGVLKPRVYDYERAWQTLSKASPAPYRRFECVFPSWDNTARRGRDATIFHGSTPESYGRWLSGAIDRTRTAHRGDEQLVFINAWNEWGEGAYLEPDTRFGRAYLAATKQAIQ